MDRNELHQLAKKYFDGTATAEEKALLTRWYDTIHDKDSLEIVTSEETEADVKLRMLNNIVANISHVEKEYSNKPGFIRRMVLTAAAAVIIALSGMWYFNTKGIVSGAPATQLVNITAQKIMKIALPDGSTVWLSAHSQFKYPADFSGKTREVQLVTGRAFFDVIHQKAHPFLVKTKNLNITVLGTSFDVRTDSREGITKVSVITGKVGITRPGHAEEPAVMLLPKQQVVLTPLSSRLKKEITPEPVVNLWCKSPLVFEQEDLDNVFKAIEKQYNTHIEVANKKLLTERISITLGNQRLDTIMEILSFTKHFKYQIANDSTVVIK